MSTDQLHDLLSALVGAPALPGARCRHKSHLFDERAADEAPEVAEQRHEQAVGLCRGCAALASCQRWYDALPRGKRPSGVVAGRAPKGERVAGEATQ